MQDRNVEFPNRFRMVKVEGTDDIYDMIPAPGDVLNPGTLLNKANLLTDETAAALGLTGEDPTVNEALRRLNQHLTDVEAVGAKIEVGSYVGTGKYGSSNKNSITFGFEPKFVYIAAQTPNNNVNGSRPHTWFWVKGSGFLYNDASHQSSGDLTNVYCTVTQSGNTISWYNSAGTSYTPIEKQANVSGKTYNYIAIG